jgi:hypothetical protein
MLLYNKIKFPIFLKNTIRNQQTIYARIINGPDCYAITPIELVVNSFDPPNFQDETVGLCEGNSITITVDPVLQVIYGTQVQIPILSLLPLLVNIPLPSPMLMVVQNKKIYGYSFRNCKYYRNNSN